MTTTEVVRKPAAMPAGTLPGRSGHVALSMLAAAALLVLICASYHLSNWRARVWYPGDELFSGVPFAEAVDLARHEPVYEATTPGSFHAAIYGPIYYLAAAGLIEPHRPSAVPVRLLSTAGLLMCIGLLGALAYRISESKLAAVFAPALFLSYGICVQLGTSARCDMVALALTLVGFALAERFHRNRLLLLSVPFFVLAVFYKQQFLAAPAAIGLSLLLQKRIRALLAYVALLAATVGAALLLFQFVVFRHQDFIRHFLLYNVSIFTASRFLYAAGITAVLFAVPALLAAEYLRRHFHLPIACYAGLALILATIGLGREGSGTSYYLEPIAILAVPVAALVAEALAQRRDAAEIACLLLFMLVSGTRIWSLRVGPEDSRQALAVTDYLRSNLPADTRALTPYPAEALRAGLVTPISDLFQYTQMVRAGIYPDRDLWNQIHRQQYGVILVALDLQDESSAHSGNGLYLTEAVHREILAQYQLRADLAMPRLLQGDTPARLYVWVPRLAAPETATKP